MTSSLSPRRGFMIEAAQPFDRLDVELAKRILDEQDEVVIGIGDAGRSHEPGAVMTAGERIEVADAALRAEGVDPNRYVLIPVENVAENTSWVAQCVASAPRWQRVYTRNFKNASIFASEAKTYGLKITTVPEQKDGRDAFKLLARELAGHRYAREELALRVSDTTRDTMTRLGILSRVDTVYNRKDMRVDVLEGGPDRALFLGGLQPLTGCWDDRNGHLGTIRLGLEQADQVVIAVGSAQESYKLQDPLTPGERIEVIRYALRSAGVDAARYFVVPIKDIPANAVYAAKLVAHTPRFQRVIAGNDWTKELFDHFEVIPVTRTTLTGSEVPISGTALRKRVVDAIHAAEARGFPLPAPEAIGEVRGATSGWLEPATFEALVAVGFLERMRFLGRARE